MSNATVKDDIAQYLATLHLAFQGYDLDYIKKQVFMLDSLQLTTFGFKCLNSSLHTHTFYFPSNSVLLVKHYIGMSKLNYPFYLSSHSISVFSEEDAIILSLLNNPLIFLERRAEDRGAT